VDGLDYQFAELNVGEIFGEASYMHTIWVDEEHLEADSTETGTIPLVLESAGGNFVQLCLHVFRGRGGLEIGGVVLAPRP